MKTWEELKTGDEILYVILNEENINELLSSKLAVNKALVTTIKYEDNSYVIKVESERFDQIVTTVPEYFTETGSVLEGQENVLIVGTDQETFTHHLKVFLKLE